jgi:hypothetical protein
MSRRRQRAWITIATRDNFGGLKESELINICGIASLLRRPIRRAGGVVVR